jgi:glycosyltransferase involved in cell wall biosynthesis
MRVVWHCEDRAGPAMAGPAIRAVELCSRLAQDHEVQLLCPGATELPEAQRSGGGRAFEVAEHAAGRSLLGALKGADVFVTQGFGFPRRDLWRLPRSIRLVVDLYDPVQLELLSRLRQDEGARGRLHLAFVRRRLLWLVSRADHVLCASERQRALWLGWLGAAGRLTPEALRDDPEARALLAVVPFGSGRLPPAEEAVRLPVPAGDAAVIWWGGMWDWMDPLTAVHAVARLRVQGIPASLVLPAGNRPGAEPMEAAARAQAEARALGLWGRGVVQLPAWVPYAQRGALLRGAAVAVSCHKPSLEAELSFRTRLLDCVWAQLPVAATAGDELSARAAQEGWARTVPPGDADALAGALRALLNPEGRERAQAAARAALPAYTWDRAVSPLLRLLQLPAPTRAAFPSAALLPELAGIGPADLVETVARQLIARARRMF